MIINVEKGLLSKLNHAVLENMPQEACGLLTGLHSETRIDIRSVHFSKNVTSENKEFFFEIDPALHIGLLKRARAGDFDIIGVWHSHPGSAAFPSEADKARSMEPAWVWLITGIMDDSFSQVKDLVFETRAFVSDGQDPTVMREYQLIEQP